MSDAKDRVFGHLDSYRNAELTDEVKRLATAKRLVELEGELDEVDRRLKQARVDCNQKEAALQSLLSSIGEAERSLRAIDKKFGESMAGRLEALSNREATVSQLETSLSVRSKELDELNVNLLDGLKQAQLSKESYLQKEKELLDVLSAGNERMALKDAEALSRLKNIEARELELARQENALSVKVNALDRSRSDVANSLTLLDSKRQEMSLQLVKLQEASDKLLKDKDAFEAHKTSIYASILEKEKQITEREDGLKDAILEYRAQKASLDKMARRLLLEKEANAS